MRPPRVLVLAAAALVGVALTPAGAAAHDLRAKVTVTATEVRVEAAYDDDTPAEGAKVTVTDAAGATVAAGVLDDTGRWQAPLPPPGEYVAVVSDAGHRDRRPFTVAGPSPAETTYDAPRLPKAVGVAVGLAVLLGGSLLYSVLRRRSAPPA